MVLDVMLAIVKRMAAPSRRRISSFAIYGQVYLTSQATASFYKVEEGALEDKPWPEATAERRIFISSL